MMMMGSVDSETSNYVDYQFKWPVKNLFINAFIRTYSSKLQ